MQSYYDEYTQHGHERSAEFSAYTIQTAQYRGQSYEDQSVIWIYLRQHIHEVRGKGEKAVQNHRTSYTDDKETG